MGGAGGYTMISIKSFNIEFKRFQYTVMFYSLALVFKGFYSKKDLLESGMRGLYGPSP